MRVPQTGHDIKFCGLIVSAMSTHRNSPRQRSSPAGLSFLPPLDLAKRAPLKAGARSRFVASRI